MGLKTYTDDDGNIYTVGTGQFDDGLQSTKFLDTVVIVNKDGAIASGASCGLGIEEGGLTTASIILNLLRTGWLLSMPSGTDSLEIIPSSASTFSISDDLTVSGPSFINQDVRNNATPTFTQISVGSPSSSDNAATKGYVDALGLGLTYLEAVLDRFDPTAALPTTPTDGDRYLSLATANGWTFENIYEFNQASSTSAYLTCGAAGSSVAGDWAALTNTGKFTITVDGTAITDCNPDFTGDATMSDVAASIQLALAAAVVGTTCVWSTDHFVITSPTKGTLTSAITVLSAPGTGTDIAGASWMNGKTGTGTVTAATDHWDETVTSSGDAVYVEAESMFYVKNGSGWVEMASGVAHNGLSGKQGGIATEYYHLTATEHTNCTRDATNAQNGLMPTAKLTNWDAAYTHKSNNGTDHSYIDQDVKAAASPTFASTTVSNATVTQHSLVSYRTSESVADDATIVITNGVAGMGQIMAGDNEEWAWFTFKADGTVNLVQTSTNVASTDTDTKLCIYDHGSGITIKNRLGGSKVIRMELMYS